MHDAPRKGDGDGGDGRRPNKPGWHAWISATGKVRRGRVGELRKGVQRVKRAWRGRERVPRVSGCAERQNSLKRVPEGEVTTCSSQSRINYRGLYQCAKQAHNFILSSGVICRFIGRTLDTLFRRYLWPRHGAARRSKVAEYSGACMGNIEKSVTAYPAKAKVCCCLLFKIYLLRQAWSAVPNNLWVTSLLFSTCYDCTLSLFLLKFTILGPLLPAINLIHDEMI